MSETARLSALHEYGVLDSPAEDELSALVRVAAVMAGVPTATLNLLDADRQCQLTTVGFAGGDSARRDAMCAAVLDIRGPVHVPDARLDPHFRDNPWVTGPLGNIRFYASVPIITHGGHVLGTICGFDDEPRRLSPAQLTALEDLASAVMALFDRRREARHAAELAAELARQREEIADREGLLSVILDSAADAFVTADSTGLVTAWNPAATAMFGWTAAEAVGRNLTELIIPPALREPHQHGLDRRAATGEIRLPTDLVLVPALRRDGTELTTELHLGSFVWHGERHFHAFLRDVTEREHDRARLARANDELAQANGELDRFTAMVAHDLKGPLTAISGYAEVLADADRDRSPHEDRALAAIGRASARMRVMIDDLLTYARAAHEPIVMSACDLNAIVDDVAAEQHAAAAGRARITRDELPVVTAHPTLLRQVLANLVGNAVKYVAPGVEPQVRVTAERAGDTVTISVADNGIGIPPEARDRVFAMFHREHGGDYRGSGVGLSTCRRIVERHHGRIWVDARHEGPGTVVHVLLPAP